MAASAEVLLLWLEACSHSHIGPGGRVSVADLRAGKLPVAVEVCITGVTTYYDPIAGTLVVQDQTGGIRFDSVSTGVPHAHPRTEVCGETRRTQSGMTLAQPNVRTLGEADLPVARRTSPEEWSRGRVDWQWIEVAGLAHAVTIDRFGIMTVHMVVEGRRVRVKVLGTGNHPSAIAHLMGAQVRASGVAGRTSIHAEPAESGLNILLAEDNPVNQRLAVRMLERRGHKVRVAGNGREALAALEAGAFDLLLTDIQMPEMDGFEVTAAIRASERLTASHQLIVAMTAHAMKGDAERCLEAGMDGYLSKPIRPEELYALLEGLAGSLTLARSPVSGRESDPALDLEPAG